MKVKYVTIGHPARREPMLATIGIVIPNEKAAREQAKTLRQEVARNAGHYGFRDTQGNVITFKPSELYWAVFDNKDDEKPALHSDNYLWGVLGENLRS